MNANDEAGKRILCHCLASVSMADGDLDAREIATMLATVEQVTGCQVSADEMVLAASTVTEEPAEFQANLTATVPDMEDAFKLMILKTCIMIGRADTFMIDTEKDHIYALGHTLGYNAEQINEQFEIIT
ncbi:MAG: TerB family tellurite resistance protein [Pseudomonadales bacterium]|nr:TerB family tellurite resistance protein [Pseudomonadales bacterium]MDG1441611.1 TerB family tellurite resistance protein [Pseudomonadales bacterium]